MFITIDSLSNAYSERFSSCVVLTCADTVCGTKSTPPQQPLQTMQYVLLSHRRLSQWASKGEHKIQQQLNVRCRMQNTSLFRSNGQFLEGATWSTLGLTDIQSYTYMRVRNNVAAVATADSDARQCLCSCVRIVRAQPTSIPELLTRVSARLSTHTRMRSHKITTVPAAAVMRGEIFKLFSVLSLSCLTRGPRHKLNSEY